MAISNVSTIIQLLYSKGGFDDEAVIDELRVTDVVENQLVDIFEDLDAFPYGETADGWDADPEDDDKRKQFIYDLIVKLRENPNLSFSSKVPTKCMFPIYIRPVRPL